MKGHMCPRTGACTGSCQHWQKAMWDRHVECRSFLSKYSMKVERTLFIGHSGWVAKLVFSSDMLLASSCCHGLYHQHLFCVRLCVQRAEPL